MKTSWLDALKGKGGVPDSALDAQIACARDTTEEGEARKAAQKQAAHAAQGRGVYRIASKAALKKDNAAAEYRRKLLVSTYTPHYSYRPLTSNSMMQHELTHHLPRAGASICGRPHIRSYA